MRKNQLIWLFVLALSAAVPALARAQDNSGMATTSVNGGISTFRDGWDAGYKTGYDNGQADHSSGAKFDADDAPGYRGYRSTYESSMGKRSEYKKAYLEGFKLGYSDGYSGLISRLITPPAPVPQAAVVQPPSPPPSTAVPQPQPEQPPATVTQAPAQPRVLPKTASGLPWLALIGFAGIAMCLALRVVRIGIGRN